MGGATDSFLARWLASKVVPRASTLPQSATKRTRCHRHSRNRAIYPIGGHGKRQSAWNNSLCMGSCRRRERGTQRQRTKKGLREFAWRFELRRISTHSANNRFSASNQSPTQFMRAPSKDPTWDSAMGKHLIQILEKGPALMASTCKSYALSTTE